MENDNSSVPTQPRKTLFSIDAEKLHPSLKKLTNLSNNLPTNPYLSSAQPKHKQPKRDLKFYKPGTFIKIASDQRQQNQLEQLKNKVDQKTFETGLSAQLTKDLIDQIPLVEWWDSQFITTYNDKQICFDSIGNLIYKPSLNSALPEEKEFVAPLPLFLTKQELKKKRKNERKEREEEKRLEIQQGTQLPDKPKIKMASMMRIVGNEAIQDPTQLELQIKQGIEERKSKHELTNQERKLTAQEMSQKKRLKYKEELKDECNCLVYKITGKGIFLNQWKFKLEVNARQNHLYGRLLQLDLGKDCFECYVIIEGGPKGISRYKRLIEGRINWNLAGETDSSPQILWEGILKYASIHEQAIKDGTLRKDTFQSINFTSKFELKKYLEGNNFNSYVKFIFE